MTDRRAKRYALETGNIAPRIVGWLVEGRATRDIARELSARRRKVSYQAVAAFARRHALEVEELRAKLESAVSDTLIAQKQWRLDELQRLYETADGVLKTRGAMAKTTKWIGGEEYGREVAEERFDKPLFDTLQGLLEQGADESGQLAKRHSPLVPVDENARPAIFNVNVIQVADGRRQVQLPDGSWRMIEGGA